MKVALKRFCAAVLLLQLAAAQEIDFAGGVDQGIYDAASAYASMDKPQSQFRKDLSSALSSAGVSASAAASGFASAMAVALSTTKYEVYGYCCAGAIAYGSKGSWTSAFSQAKSLGLDQSEAAAAVSACSGGAYGSDVAEATASAAASAFGSAAAAASASGRRLLSQEPSVT